MILILVLFDKLQFLKFFLSVLAGEKSPAIDVLVLPMDVTDYNSHKDHAHVVMDHFQRVSELNMIQNVI